MARSPRPPEGAATHQPSEEPTQRRILVVEDDRDMRTMLWRYLPTRGWHVTTAADGLSALQYLRDERFDAVLADERLPGPSGATVLECARIELPDATLVLFGGWLSQDARRRAHRIGAVCVTKGSTDSLALLTTVLDET